MPERPVLSVKQRDSLFAKLKEDSAFRETLKKDWRKAMESVSIKPDAIAKGVLSRQEIEDFAGSKAAWTIEIVIAAKFPGAERVQLKEAVNFEAR